MTPFDSPRLIADIGATFARFALETSPRNFVSIASLRIADFPDLHATVVAYLKSVDSPAVQHAAIAVANPVEGDFVRLTNAPWQFSIEDERTKLGLRTLVVVNDFTSLAMAVPNLQESELRQVGGGTLREGSVIGVIGAGSGLGVSGLIPADHGWVALGTEGGHTSFSPRNAREIAILDYAWNEFEHVSFERLLSGRGIALMYQALAKFNHQSVAVLAAEAITQRALDGSDAIALETLHTFCEILGTASANLAVTLGAKSGIYVGGAIVPRLGEFFDKSSFRQRFEEKGRFSDYLRDIPTFVISAEHATFRGVSAVLEAQLRNLQARGDSGLLSQIQRGVENFSPAERRVAEYILSRPREFLNQPIVQIAQLANVSQPTVIRFCRTLGATGLSDLKLRLAAAVTGTIPVSHAQITDDDSTAELGSKVLSNTASAILRLRDQINQEAIDRAIDLLSKSKRTEIFAGGNDFPVAVDAQAKLLRVGVTCGYHPRESEQLLVANLLQAGSVALILDNDGRSSELREVAEISRERGVSVIALTLGQTTLARRADVTVLIDHVENMQTQLPMVSRILHLLVIDILAVGVALRRNAPAELANGNEATLLTHITSHGQEAMLGTAQLAPAER
ncbi:MAG: glucokinase [Casimicrobium sp.]